MRNNNNESAHDKSTVVTHVMGCCHYQATNIRKIRPVRAVRDIRRKSNFQLLITAKHKCLEQVFK